ncbi:MAG: glycoside hydrolase, partial [Cyanobacteria bacterium P01_H01_bin.121]
MHTTQSVSLATPHGASPQHRADAVAVSNPTKATVQPMLQQQAQGVCVTVHGHFYQPPRENPYLEAIERQPSASPAHDWNERIYWECYRPNAFARILSQSGDVLDIVNNFEYLSFNIGPTLMSWLADYDPEVYQRIIEGDRLSCQRYNGHGNAIAQAYNHIILPLANEHDKRTQIRWGKADFRQRFGRDPEGMWLAETAVDYPTLAHLIAEGIKFIILAPSQAERCRLIPHEHHPDPDWQAVGGGQIDPT